MNTKELIIVGTGGHSKVVTETAQCLGWSIAVFIDENSSTPELYRGIPVFKDLQEVKKRYPQIKSAFVAIGSNDVRKRWNNILQKNDYILPTLCHPSAYISPTARIDSGTLIYAKAVVGAACHIQEGVIINSATIVDHDAVIGAYSHLSQGAIACGGVRVGSECLIGPGVVLEKLASIADHSVVTAAHSINSPL